MNRIVITFIALVLTALVALSQPSDLLPQRITQVNVTGADVVIDIPFAFEKGTPDLVTGEILRQLADNGYPFATCRIESIDMIDDGDFAMRISCDKGEKVTVSGAYLQSGENIKTKVSTIEKQMLLRKGSVYSLSNVERGLARVNRMGTFRISGGTDHEIVRAESGKWYISLSGEDVARSSLGGAVGFSREGDETDLGGRLEADLRNIWGGGRRIYFLWDALDENRTLTELSLKDPHLPNTFLGAELAWSSTGREHYRESQLYLGIIWPLSFELATELGIDLGWIAPDSIGLINMPKEQSYGLRTSLELNTMDAPSFPKRGIKSRLSLTGAMGKKQSTTLSPERLEDAYSLTADLTLSATHFFGMVGISEEIIAEGILATTTEEIAPSAMSYIGGFGSLRGFPTDFTSAERTVVARTQIPVRLAPQSEIFTFMDIGLLHSTNWDSFTGYGIGILTETQIGTLSISYGLSEGRSITEGLLHFGIKTSF